MKLLILFCLIFFAHLSHAQNDSVVRYWKYGKDGKSPNVETKNVDEAVTRAVYYLRNGLWEMESRFIATGQLYMIASYSDAKWERREGTYVGYDQDGRMFVKAFFTRGKENGLYQSWHDNGSLRDSCLMVAGTRVGKSVAKDKDGNVVASYDLDDKGNGPVTYFKDNQSVSAKGNYKEGKREGNWIYYGDGDYKEWEVVYSRDSVLSFNCFRADGTSEEGCVFEREANPFGGTIEWCKWLEKEIMKHGYPSRKFSKRKSAAELSGQVHVKFLVGKDGSIIDAEIVRSLNEEADKIVLQVILSSPKWIPAIQRNRYVMSYRTQPITFYFPG